VACPYFMPVSRLENGSWPHPSRLPLGSGYAGHCTAPGHEGAAPEQNVVEAFCNLGYAAGCSWAPRERTWDAIRFAVASPSSGVRNSESVETRAQRIRICYVCERDHRPVHRGDLEFDLQGTIWLQSHEDQRLQKMAECFLDSYLKRNRDLRQTAQ
jgi:hypothetical protein